MKTSFQTSAKNLDRLFESNRIAAEVWNDCLKISKEYFLAEKKWIGKTVLQKAVKGQYPLHSQSVQAVCHKYLDAREAAKKAKIEGHSNKYPYKQKKYFNTKWAKQGFRFFENGKIELSMGTWQGKRQKPILVQLKELPEGEVKEIELLYDRGLKLSLSYEDGRAAFCTLDSNACGVDLGEIHAIASVSENSSGIIITGRKLRSIKRLRNKKLAQLQRKMSRCKKGSRKWKRYNRAKNWILAKSDRQLIDGLHKISANFVKWALENKIGEVAVGDIEGVQRGTSAKNKNSKRRRSRKVNQKLSQWDFGKLQKYMEYKLAGHGIRTCKVDEAYTTQQCPCCGKRKKTSSRNYSCSCGYRQHRDIHGAHNILAKFRYGKIKDLGLTIKTKYLRIA